MKVYVVVENEPYEGYDIKYVCPSNRLASKIASVYKNFEVMDFELTTKLPTEIKREILKKKKRRERYLLKIWDQHHINRTNIKHGGC